MLTPKALRPKKSTWLKDAAAIAAAASVVLVARSSLADHYHVPSGSMLPTVEIDDHIFVNKAAYGLRLPFTHVQIVERSGPLRGDVVVLESPESGIVLLKRVVAEPGDTIEVRSGHLFLNGAAVETEDGKDSPIECLDHCHPVTFSDGGGPDFGPVKVPEGSYLVLGDNRGNSRDGRYFGFVKREAILGRAVGVLAREGKPTWIGL